MFTGTHTFHPRVELHAHMLGNLPQRGEVRWGQKKNKQMDGIKWVKESVANYLSVCLCLSTCHMENMWRRVLWNLFRMVVVAHWQTALPCSASSLLSFLTPFDIFNYVFHTWLSFFFSFYTYLITLFCFSLTLPPSYFVPPPLFHFLFKWPLPHCFMCRVFSYVGVR